MGILDEFSLTGRTAAVTGVSRKTGLCYGMATALREAGAKVAFVDVSQGAVELAAELGGAENGYHAVIADIGAQDAAECAIQECRGLLGGLDIVVNGAGLQFRADAIDFPPDKWEKVIAINLSASFYVAQAAARIMMAQGGGSIINIASMTSFVASRRIPAYAASKGGIAQLTKALSNEWAGKGVRVNAIAPGYMETELTKDMVSTEQGRQHTMRIPMGRWGNATDLRGIVVFLASDASAYISGAIMPVDGGYLGA